MTRHSLVAVIGALALLGTACGSDATTTSNAPNTAAADSVAAPTTAAAPPTTAAASSAAGTIAAEVVRQAQEQGLVLDAACVEAVAEQLTEADQQLLIDGFAEGNTDPQLSAAGATLGVQIIGCADTSSLVDSMMDSFGSIPGMDAECIRGVLEQLDPEQLSRIAQGDTSGSGEESTQIMGCLTGS